MKTPQDFFGTAVKKLAPNGTYDTDGKTILLWKSPGIEEPSQADIDAKIVEFKAEWAVNEYARNRKEEYPEMADQLDMIYWDGVNETTTHKDAVNAIKTKYPKP